MKDTLTGHITLAHGAGGKQTSALIQNIFKKYFNNPYLTADDAAVLPRPGRQIAMSTDGFVVSPAFFPGGNIGELSVCGTVNDLSCMGARPLYLTCSFIIEEGLDVAVVDQIAKSMAETAERVGVALVAGDTKVVGKGQADQVFITTTGVGELMPDVHLAGENAKPGDAVLVTGDVGRHGCAVLLARDEYGIDAHVTSDCAPLWHPISAALETAPDIHVIRDATRGGVGTVLYEIAHQSHVGIQLKSEAVPVDPAVSGVCGMLGLEPLYLACEGRMVMIMPQDKADAVIDALSVYPDTKGICQIGVVTAENPERVVMETAIGAQTFLPEPGTELLPRIC